MTLITLGVSDYARAKAFYAALGWLPALEVDDAFRTTTPTRTAGAFRDFDGHAWEIAHNPVFGLDADGNIVLPSSNVP